MLTAQGQAKVAAAGLRAGGTAAGATGPRVYYDFAPACGANVLTDTNINCAAPCPDPNERRFFVYSGTDPARLTRQAGVSVCLAAADAVTPADIRAAVEAYIRDQLAITAPTVHVAPPGQTLVNLPTLFNADPQHLGPLTLTFYGVGVTLTVTPTYDWTFGNGDTARAAGPGRGYDGTSPRQNPDYYLSTTYRERGRYTAALSVRWTPSYRIDGLPGTYTTTPVTRRTTIPVDVVEGRAHLIDPG